MMNFSTFLVVFAAIICIVVSQAQFPGPYPAPRRNNNAFQGLGPGTTCNDSFHLVTNYWWQVLLQKHQQYRVIKDHLHPLVISDPLNDLAYNHSRDDMAATNTVNSNGYFARRQTIQQHPEWLTRLDLQPDPKFPPIAITYIDELYGAGNNPSAAFQYILDYGGDIIRNHSHQFIGVGVYCQPQPQISFGENRAAFWWVTIILVGVCAPANQSGLIRNTSNPASNFLCCDLNNTVYGQCLANLPPDSSITLFVNNTSTGMSQPVCCDYIQLNGTNAVPSRNTNYTGTAITTTYIGPNEQQSCFCVSHNAPTINNPSSAPFSRIINSAEIHFGRRGVQTDQAPIFRFSATNIRNQSFRECWNFVNSGLCYENIASGNLYIDLKNNETAPASLIRGQLQCEFMVNSFFGGTNTSPLPITGQ